MHHFLMPLSPFMFLSHEIYKAIEVCKLRYMQNVVNGIKIRRQGIF